MNQTAKPSFSLGDRWSSRLAQKYEGEHQKPLTQKERGQLKMLANKVGPQTKELIDFAINNWLTFARKVSFQAGLGDYPTRPYVGFLLAYHHVALSLMQSIAAKPKQVEPPPPAPSAVAKNPVDCFKEEGKAANADFAPTGERSRAIKIDSAENLHVPFTEGITYSLLAELEEIIKLRYPERFKPLPEISGFPEVSPLPEYETKP